MKLGVGSWELEDGTLFLFVASDFCDFRAFFCALKSRPMVFRAVLCERKRDVAGARSHKSSARFPDLNFGEFNDAPFPKPVQAHETLQIVDQIVTPRDCRKKDH